MNRDDMKLQRLFAAARTAQPAPAEEMPPYLAGRVIAHLRAGTLKDDSWPTVVRVFRRALVCAGLVMVFSLALFRDGLNTAPDNDEAYANYQLSADELP